MRLLSLKEIADALGVHYKTLCYYKDRFEELLVIQYQGRRVKYHPANIELFAKILEFKDEGVSNEEIFERLNVDPDGWMDGEADGRMNGRTTGGTDGRMDGGTDEPPDGRMGEWKEALASVSEQVERQTQTVQSRERSRVKRDVEDVLKALGEEISRVFNAWGERMMEVRSHVQEMEERLAGLERELGVAVTEHAEWSTWEKERLRVRIPEIAATEEAEENHGTEIEDVRDGVIHGKPDRSAVVGWIRGRKAENAELSYGDLAKELDAAGIPTLRGRQGWNRNVVRSLAIEQDG